MHPLATSVSQFENKYSRTAATSADEVGDWFSRRFGDYTAVPLDSTRPGETIALSGTSFSGFQTTFARWGFSAEGTSLADLRNYCLGIPLAGSSVVHDVHFGKITCQENQARIFRRNAGTRVVASAGNDMLTLAIPASPLEARARGLYDRDFDEPLRFSPLIDLDARNGTAIIYLFNHLLTLLTCADEALEHEIVCANLSDHLMTTVLGLLPHNYDDSPGTTPDCGVPKAVRRAEDWIHAHAHEPITMEILAREAGCSERALQNAFKTFRDKTPTTVLRDMRLDRAHSELKLEPVSVTDVAFKWGFSNLGRFAALYKARFHEKPSQTTRKTTFREVA